MWVIKPIITTTLLEREAGVGVTPAIGTPPPFAASSPA
jgi:hypothetical protein